MAKKIEEAKEEEVVVNSGPVYKTAKYLLADFSADCPIDGYAGRIAYPKVMTLPGYQAWSKYAAEQQTSEEKNTLVFYQIVEDEDDKGTPGVDSVNSFYIDISKRFAKMELTYSKPNANGVGYKKTAVDLDDPTQEHPWQLDVWCGLTAKEWIEAQLSFRLPQSNGLSLV